jgi:DNA-binding transcriptional ArsR family regulator/DNA-binding XRE family transcriptional regulator
VNTRDEPRWVASLMADDEEGLGDLDQGWIRSLGHPIRVVVLRRMLDGEVTTPGALAEELELPLPVVGYHVRFLRDAGQLKLVRRSQRRGAIVHHYRLRDADATRAALRRLGYSRIASSSLAVGSSDPWEPLARALAVLRASREAQGISRDALARSLRISASQLASIERGETDPRFTVLIAMAHELGTTLGEVFTAAQA